MLINKLLNYKKKNFRKTMKKQIFKEDNTNINNNTYIDNKIVIKKQHYKWDRYPGIYIPKKKFINNTLYSHVEYDSENKNNIIFIILVYIFLIKRLL